MDAQCILNYGTCKLLNMLCVKTHLVTFSKLEFAYFKVLNQFDLFVSLISN